MSDQSEELLREILKSTNRTTRAVRAFVRFLFIQLSAITLAVLVFQLGNLTQNPASCDFGVCPPSPGWTLLAGLIWLIGVIWSSIAGWSELEMSDPGYSTIAPVATSRLSKVNPSGVFSGYSEASLVCFACNASMKPEDRVCASCGAHRKFG